MIAALIILNIVKVSAAELVVASKEVGWGKEWLRHGYLIQEEAALVAWVVCQLLWNSWNQISSTTKEQQTS